MSELRSKTYQRCETVGIITVFSISFTVLLFVLIAGTVRWIWKHLQGQIRGEKQTSLEEARERAKEYEEILPINELEDLRLEIMKKDQINIDEGKEALVQEQEENAQKKDKWECQYCGHRNPPNKIECEYCGMKIEMQGESGE